MYKVNVQLIKPGSSTIDPGNMASAVEVSVKHQIGVGGGSTVTLIRERDEVLLVDTGYDRESEFSQVNDEANWNLLEALLKRNGLRPTDVTKVFVTHFHRDHFGGIEHFEHAQWYCHRAARVDFRAPIKDKFIPLEDGEQIIPNTAVTHTPGHTKGHASILWTDARRLVRIGICGDAIISLAWLQSGYTWKFNSDFFGVKASKESIARLLKETDLLIPGHGQPFFSRTATGVKHS